VSEESASRVESDRNTFRLCEYILFNTVCPLLHIVLIDAQMDEFVVVISLDATVFKHQ